MYEYHDLNQLALQAENAAKAKIDRYGISVYVDCDPDYAGADVVIDPLDTVALDKCREFLTWLSGHYKTLNDGSGVKA